jgi:C-methyltransferase C-terminal domain/Putative zinc binding domain/Methyltransferase domain
MTESSIATACCSCGARKLATILDLGSQPDPDALLDPADAEPAPEAPVELALCMTCGLAQLLGDRPVGPRPAHGHAMHSSPEDPWVQLIEHLLQASRPVVWDVDGSSGVPAASLAAPGCVVAGPSSDAATVADLILVGHALSHVDDLDVLVRRIATALAPRGLAAIDFHHVVGLAQGQFDVVSHAHRSYLSLHSLEHALHRHGLGVIATQRIAEYGGTVRVLAAHQSANMAVDDARFSAAQIREVEKRARVDQPSGYEGLELRVRVACADLVGFLSEARRSGRTVVGYGAASRGTTLINIAGIGADLLSFVVDRAPAKQGRLLPRARIPVLGLSEIQSGVGDDILILPWPLADQIIEQLAVVRDRGARFVVALPQLEILR